MPHSELIVQQLVRNINVTFSFEFSATCSMHNNLYRRDGVPRCMYLPLRNNSCVMLFIPNRWTNTPCNWRKTRWNIAAAIELKCISTKAVQTVCYSRSESDNPITDAIHCSDWAWNMKRIEEWIKKNATMEKIVHYLLHCLQNFSFTFRTCWNVSR